jgi:hypothetical protein
MIEYKTWEGKWPHVILLSPDIALTVLYYETGFEQLHPLPEVLDWMTERSYNYDSDWKVVRVNDNPANRSDWAVCFNNKQACELFVLKWL